MRSSIALCGAALAALLFVACGGGGDDGPTARQEVKVATARALETDDAATFCHKYASKGYLRTVYGGHVAKCVKASSTVPEVSGKAKATTAVLKPDEAHADVAVSIKGGTFDGTTGHVEMVKEGAWKVDKYADDFIRSAFLASIQTTDEGAVSVPRMKACFTRQVKDLPAAAIRRVIYAADDAEEKQARKVFLKLADGCPESALAEYGAHTLTDELVNKGNHKPGYVKCLYREIKFGLELTEITTELLAEHPNFAATAAIGGIAEGAKQNCGG